MESIKAHLATLEQHALLSLARGSASVWIAGGTLALALFGASAVNATTVHSHRVTPTQSTITWQHHCPYEGGGYITSYADYGD